MGDNHEHNIFKKLKDKFKTPANVAALNDKVNITEKEEYAAMSAINKQLDAYRTFLLHHYANLLRLLNGHPNYVHDPAVCDTEENVYYTASESPAEKVLLQAKRLRELMWDNTMAGCVVRTGLEISELEKVFQRNGHRQLFYIREFLYTDYPRITKTVHDSLLYLAKGYNMESSQRKKDKALKESNRLLAEAKAYVNELPSKKEKHMRCVVYLLRCYREYHRSVKIRFEGMGAVRLPESV